MDWNKVLDVAKSYARSVLDNWTSNDIDNHARDDILDNKDLSRTDTLNQGTIQAQEEATEQKRADLRQRFKNKVDQLEKKGASGLETKYKALLTKIGKIPNTEIKEKIAADLGTFEDIEGFKLANEEFKFTTDPEAKKEHRAKSCSIFLVEEQRFSFNQDPNVMKQMCELMAKAELKYEEYQKKVESRQYGLALEDMNEIPRDELTVPQRKLKKILQNFQKAEEVRPEEGMLVTTDEDVGEEIAAKVKRLYAKTLRLILSDKKEVAKEVLVYIQHIYPEHLKAKTLLELEFDLPPGSYKVRDISKKYDKRSSNYFYGGNYMLAEKDLKVLAIIDKENPEVFERLGSTYYMMNQKQKAIDAWTTALIYDPENKELEAIIEKTKNIMKEDAKKGSKGKKERVVQKVEIEDPQVMGVFKSQSQAFALSKKLRQKGLEVLIEENEDEKWVVIVSRAKLLKANEKEKKGSGSS